MKYLYLIIYNYLFQLQHLFHQFLVSLNLYRTVSKIINSIEWNNLKALFFDDGKRSGLFVISIPRTDSSVVVPHILGPKIQPSVVFPFWVEVDSLLKSKIDFQMKNE